MKDCGPASCVDADEGARAGRCRRLRGNGPERGRRSEPDEPIARAPPRAEKRHLPDRQEEVPSGVLKATL